MSIAPVLSTSRGMEFAHCSSDDDDGDGDVLRKGFRKGLDALKRACDLSTLSTLSSVDYGNYSSEECKEDAEDEDAVDSDDEELLLSIQKKFGATTQSLTKLCEEPIGREDEEFSPFWADDEEDDAILRSVEKRFGSLDRLEHSVRQKDRGSKKRETDPGDNGFQLGTKERKEDTAIESEKLENDGSKPGLPPIDTEDEEAEASRVGVSLPGQFEVFDYASPDLSSEPANGISSDMPENMATVLDALKKNRHCQKFLQSKLAQIESKLEENKHLRRRTQTLIDFEKLYRRRFAGFLLHETNPYIKLISVSSTSKRKAQPSKSMEIVCSKAHGPPENEDVGKLRALQKIYPLVFELKSWSREERRELVKGVKQQVQENLVCSAMETMSENGTLCDATSLDERIKAVGEVSLTGEVLRNALPNVNWNDVARIYVVGRSGSECKMQWLNDEDLLINHGQWTKAEDKKLLNIAQQHEFCNWDLISHKLGTNRTPAQCLIRYQRSLNAGIMRGAWTHEEDKQLCAAVELYGERDWQTVASGLEGRTGSQCCNRWYKNLHPARQKSGRWDIEEDKRLRWAVSIYGPRMWRLIAGHVIGRTEVQCRERWCNVLDPSLKLEEWTDQEDRRLEEAVAKHGKHHWCAVANDLKPRTDNQCWRRWKCLHPEHLSEFQKDAHIRKVALVSNFVGRKKERPRLGPSDFISESISVPESHSSLLQNQKNRRHPIKNKLTRNAPSDNLGRKRTRDDILIQEQGKDAKTCREERIKKMRLARSLGKLQFWGRRKRNEIRTM
eukprot:c29226_g1_i2 orf=382-2736(-)